MAACDILQAKICRTSHGVGQTNRQTEREKQKVREREREGRQLHTRCSRVPLEKMAYELWKFPIRF